MAVSEFAKGRIAAAKAWESVENGYTERLARQHDTITNLLAYLESKGKVAEFVTWQEKNGKTPNLDNWKQAHPRADK